MSRTQNRLPRILPRAGRPSTLRKRLSKVFSLDFCFLFAMLASLIFLFAMRSR